MKRFNRKTRKQIIFEKVIDDVKSPTTVVMCFREFYKGFNDQRELEQELEDILKAEQMRVPLEAMVMRMIDVLGTLSYKSLSGRLYDIDSKRLSTIKHRAHDVKSQLFDNLDFYVDIYIRNIKADNILLLKQVSYMIIGQFVVGCQLDGEESAIYMATWEDAREK